MVKNKGVAILFLLSICLCACAKPLDNTPVGTVSIDDIAESYVKLVLEVGLYNSDVVDAYYGLCGHH